MTLAEQSVPQIKTCAKALFSNHDDTGSMPYTSAHDSRLSGKVGGADQNGAAYLLEDMAEHVCRRLDETLLTCGLVAIPALGREIAIADRSAASPNAEDLAKKLANPVAAIDPIQLR